MLELRQDEYCPIWRGKKRVHYACLGRSIPFEKNAEYEEERERKKVEGRNARRWSVACVRDVAAHNAASYKQLL